MNSASLADVDCINCVEYILYTMLNTIGCQRAIWPLSPRGV